MNLRPPWKPRLRRSDAPLYAALVEALAADIASGRLRSGDRLPTHRELASTVGVSLGTVTRAYAEAEQRGLIRSQVGNGTFVRDLGDPNSYSPVLDPSRIDLGPTAVPIIPGDLGHRALSASLAALAQRADLAALSGYQSHGGSEAQRALGARWLALLGLEASPDEVTLCSGAQHATALLLAVLATPAGVLVEELTYPGVLSASQLLHLPTHPVALDAQGLVPESLERACRTSGARVLYCTPTHHNPTSATQSPARRKAIAALCREHDLTLIENGALAPLAVDAPAPITALIPERGYFISTLSKATVPALRVGFIRAPASARATLELAAAATVWSASPLLTEVAMQWLSDGTATALRDARRAEASARQAIAASVLKGHPYRSSPSSSLLWLPVPESRRALELIEEARARGVLIGPAHLFAARAGSAPNAVRVSLGAARSREELERGLRILAELLSTSSPRRLV